MKVQQLHVGAGTTLGPLSIFPIWTAGPGQLGISTGTHADVAVTELASGAQVNKLTVTNNGPRPALLLEGELLEGGQQHRTCARDVVLGASETPDIDTYCVEAGRWQAGENSHRRQGRRAPLNIRAELASRSEQRGGAEYLGAGAPFRRSPGALRYELHPRPPRHPPVQSDQPAFRRRRRT